MSVTYSAAAIDARLNGVVSTVGSSGFMIVRAGTTTLVTIQLANPCGAVSGGVLTFNGPMIDTSADASGNADNVLVTDSASNVVISGLAVGIPLSGAEVILSNGLNTTAISAGQVVQCLSAQITGS
jgi:hypothetical protein